jgi:uncharacterized protein YndB with AHSA1/START domain
VGAPDAGLTGGQVQTATIVTELPGEPSAVFEWLTDPVLLVRWWPTEAETDPRPGGAYRMYWAGPDVTLRGEYRRVVDGEHLDFTWTWDHDDLPPRDVAVRFESCDRGTKLTVDHQAESDAEATDYLDGWTHFLHQLAAQLGSE